MAEKRTLKDVLIIGILWLIAAALVYVVIVKLKLFFHN